jgi:hypothetical protein
MLLLLCILYVVSNLISILSEHINIYNQSNKNEKENSKIETILFLFIFYFGYFVHLFMRIIYRNSCNHHISYFLVFKF